MFERQTIISSEVLELLKNSKCPLSVLDIMIALKKKQFTPNKTTIYRIIKKLLSKNIITEINIKNGQAEFELADKNHYHFYCNSCDTTFCLDYEISLKNQINFSKLLPDKKFHIQSHKFNLYGICDPCTKKP